MREIYEKYEQLRDECGVSDFRVAQDIGISRSIISEWKTGEHNPSLQSLAKIAKYFGVSIEYFLEEEKSEGQE